MSTRTQPFVNKPGTILEIFVAEQIEKEREKERERQLSCGKEANPLCGIFQSVSGKIKLSGATQREIIFPPIFFFYKYKPINTFTGWVSILKCNVHCF